VGYRMKWGDLECCISNGVRKGDLRGRDNAASAGTTLRIGRLRNTARFFCASKRPGRLQGPLVPLLICYLGVFILGETNLPPFASEFRMSGAVLPYTLPHSFMACTGAAFEEIGLACLTFLF